METMPIIKLVSDAGWPRREGGRHKNIFLNTNNTNYMNINLCLLVQFVVFFLNSNNTNYANFNLFLLV